MPFRKLRAAEIFTGTTMLDDDKVLILDDHHMVQDIVPLADAGDDVQIFKGLLTPGFVNAHCHLELSHLQGLVAQHTGLVDFVFQIVTQRHFPLPEIEAAITLADEQMHAAGIVAVGDICNTVFTLPQKKISQIDYFSFAETSGWDPAVAAMRFAHGQATANAFQTGLSASADKSRYHTASMAAHAPYSVSEHLWHLLEPTFSDRITTIHNQETVSENDFFRNGTGDFLSMYEKMNVNNTSFVHSEKSSLQTYLHRYKSAKRLLLVHDTFTSAEDIEYAQAQHQNLSWCLCVNANLYIENALPPIDLLRSNNCHIVLGTDSLASNHTLSILDEMKTLTQNFPAIPLTEILRWATLNGAEALGMDQKLGSFEKGKQPGVVLIEGLQEGFLQPTCTLKRVV